jgi:hypothetical protein
VYDVYELCKECWIEAKVTEEETINDTAEKAINVTEEETIIDNFKWFTEKKPLIISKLIERLQRYYLAGCNFHKAVEYTGSNKVGHKFYKIDINSHRLLLRMGPDWKKWIEGGGVLTHDEYEFLRKKLKINRS